MAQSANPGLVCHYPKRLVPDDSAMTQGDSQRAAAAKQLEDSRTNIMISLGRPSITLTAVLYIRGSE